MSHKKEDVVTYIIPPNFIDAGTVFGGMFKLRMSLKLVLS